MKDIIPAKKQSPILGLTGMGGGVGSNLGGSATVEPGPDSWDTFSTTPFLGNNSNQRPEIQVDFTTAEDDSGLTGGAVLIKCRENAGAEPSIISTQLPADNYLRLTNSASESTGAGTSWFSNGWRSTSGYTDLNANNRPYVAQNFRRRKGFFDVVTYTGNGVSGRQIAHNLGCKPGMMWVKCRSNSQPWNIYHTGIGATKYFDGFNSNTAATSSTRWNDTEPTDTHFTVGNGGDVNYNGYTYIAFIWADGSTNSQIFGPEGDQSIVKCGNWSGNGYIDLGWEPSLLFYKRTDSSSNGDWFMIDQMRKWNYNGDVERVSISNTGGTDNQNGEPIIRNPKGFTVQNLGGQQYIYCAVRSGPLFVLPSSDKKKYYRDDTNFSNNTSSPYANYMNTGNNNQTNRLDLTWMVLRNSGGQRRVQSRMMKTRYMHFSNSDASSDAAFANVTIDNNNTSKFQVYNYQSLGIQSLTSSTATAAMYAMMTGHGFLDIGWYTGTGSAQDIAHNLGVDPAMIWVKSMNWSSGKWTCWHKDLPAGWVVKLDTSWAAGIDSSGFGQDNTKQNKDTFRVISDVHTNSSNSSVNKYQYMIFPEAAEYIDPTDNKTVLYNMAKCGSYTGTGSNQTINCGFPSAARFIWVRCTSNEEGAMFTGSDSANNIDDGYFYGWLDTVGRQQSNSRFATFAGSGSNGGFTVKTASDVNGSGRTFIYWAIC